MHTSNAYVCKFCNKRFGRKGNYEEHLRIHTGEAPFECIICKRRFTHRNGLKNHMKTHEGINKSARSAQTDFAFRNENISENDQRKPTRKKQTFNGYNLKIQHILKQDPNVKQIISSAAMATVSNNNVSSTVFQRPMFCTCTYQKPQTFNEANKSTRNQQTSNNYNLPFQHISLGAMPTASNNKQHMTLHTINNTYQCLNKRIIHSQNNNQQIIKTITQPLNDNIKCGNAFAEDYVQRHHQSWNTHSFSDEIRPLSPFPSYFSNDYSRDDDSFCVEDENTISNNIYI